MREFWIDLAGRWMNDMVTDVGRYVVFAVTVSVTLYLLLAATLHARKIREETPPARQWITEFFISIRSVAIFSTVGLAIFLLNRAGLMPLPRLAASWGPVWFWVSLAAMIVGHDAYFYWAHRTMHRPRFFRTFHRRHHRSHNPTPFSAYSFDLAEAGVMATFVPLWLLIFPTSFEVVGLFMLHQIARNTLGHAGYELMPVRKDGRPMFDFLTTATHHNLHHAQAGWNHGLYFTWWDRMMGTEHPHYHARFAEVVGRPLLDRTGAAQVESAGA